MPGGIPRPRRRFSLARRIKREYPPRPMRTCIHTKSDGLQCGSPAMRHNIRCYFHAQHARRRMKSFVDLPPLTDPRTRNFLLTEIMNGILQGTIDPETARSLIYAVHIQSCV